MTDKLELTDAEWREKLSPEQYHILREAGTERAFTGKYEKNKQAGEYHCAACGQLVFGRGAQRYQHGNAPHRSGLRQVREPFGPCFPRWAGPGWSALLHQQRLAGFRT